MLAMAIISLVVIGFTKVFGTKQQKPGPVNTGGNRITGRISGNA